MKVSELDYFLPKELIAQKPAKPRDHAKLLVCIGNRIEHKKFFEIEKFFKKGDVLVLNETKVSKVKIYGRKKTGSPCSLIVEHKISDRIFQCRIQTNKPKKGNILIFSNGLEGEIIEAKKEEGIFIVKFNKDLEKILKRKGALPLPPYIKEKIKDSEYQTVFAKKLGSLAAPTAGLHFTKRLLQKLQKKGVKIAKINLQIGFGTFVPIEVENLEQHKMFEEYFEVPQKAAKIINERKGRLWICGTTCLRALESSAEDNGKIVAKKGKTDLFIYPPYKFKSRPDFLITNFHLPRSTLLALVFAFAGKEKVMECYKEAIAKKYRFYSLGDACLFARENSQPQ